MRRSLLCRVLGHNRSRRRAHRRQGLWVSNCRYCGVELQRWSPRDWRIVTPDGPLGRLAQSARRVRLAEMEEHIVAVERALDGPSSTIASPSRANSR
jgi:hypothetical protein